MKHKFNAGFSLIEVLVAIVVLGAFVVPTCASLVLSARMNAKTESLMQAQLAVSSAVETLMAEGIDPDLITNKYADDEYGIVLDSDNKEIDNYPTVKVIIDEDNSQYYSITVSDNDGLVTVTTTIRAKEVE